MNITTFHDKLNVLDDNLYTIEEEVVPINGVYEAELIHDNVTTNTINVYTGSKLTGNKITTYVLSTPSLTPWKKIIKIFSTESKLYITYETIGDQVEAIDVNYVQDAIVDTQENLNSEIDRAKSAENTLQQNINNETNRAIESENDIRTELHTDAVRWDEAYSKMHIHSNKTVLDALNKDTEGELTFEGGKIISTTVNGLSDDVTITGGNNISVSKNGNTLTITGIGQQEKIVINTPITISSSDWGLNTTEMPNYYTVNINHGLDDENILVVVYKDGKTSETVDVTIVDGNNIVLTNYEAIDCKIVINSSGQPTEVIDNLTSSDSNKALSAKQGVVLKELIASSSIPIVIGNTFDTAQPISLFFKIIG